MSKRVSPWLRWLTDGRRERLLVVVPAAGAGAAMFRPWATAIGTDTDVVVVTAPGREHRIAEPALRHVEPLAEAVVAELGALGRPFTLFGHSAGGLIAYHVVAMMPNGGVRHVVVAATTSPDCGATNYARSSDAELIEALRAWGGTPEEVLDDPAMVELFLPCLRADLAVAYSCRAETSDHPMLDVPITALVGSEDRFATSDQAAGWQRFTTAPFALHIVTGGHHFPVTNNLEVLRLVVGGA